MKLKSKKNKHAYKAKFTKAEIKVLRKLTGNSTRLQREDLGIAESEEDAFSSVWLCISGKIKK